MRVHRTRSGSGRYPLDPVVPDRVEPDPPLTIHVHVCTIESMTHKTSASRLKARMGQYMRAVRAGEEIVVTDRDQPVARLVPFKGASSPAPDTLPIVQPKDPGAPPLGKVRLRAIRYRGRSTTELLLQDRKRR